VVPAKEFKRRMVVEIDGAPHMIEQIQVQTPSARGAATLYKIKARNLKTKTRTEKSYRGTDALNESSFERRPVQYLYRDAEALHFMDSSSFNQFSLSCRIRSSCRSWKPRRASAATRQPAGPSRPHFRRASSSRCPNISIKAQSSASTHGLVNTSAGLGDRAETAEVDHGAQPAGRAWK
jgi:translation elongation factor P/translation initiation factor 5A